MNIWKSVKLMRKYNSCPVCGSDRLGNGEGKLLIEENTFHRSCKCGWKIETNEDGKIVNKE